jgi:hypothetical protein
MSGIAGVERNARGTSVSANAPWVVYPTSREAATSTSSLRVYQFRHDRMGQAGVFLELRHLVKVFVLCGGYNPATI